ncbi:disease resistance protein RPS4-like [Orbicella faveolata]|uniref:disease resistance protein RPS4-like n=1 Tax=Orbicella faveolata TaxID=48498 RepID=UPI0009E64B29|nr:disease resistance protein RPS4-like [Orbicella faveolata]
MAAVSGSPPGYQELFTNISFKFNPTESEDVVQSLKRNYGGKFNSLDNQDLLSSLQLLSKHGFLSDNKLTLIEEYVAPKSKQKEQIKQMIKSFKDSLEEHVDPEKELPGRQKELGEITKKLETTERSLVVNLFGSAGVGKTTLAKRVCSKWQGKNFVFDLREAKDMRAIYLNLLSSLGLTVAMGYVDLNSVVTVINEKIQVLNQPILFLLDNVDQFTAGQGKEGKNLKRAFLQFLGRLSGFDGKEKETSLKVLLTSRNPLEDAKSVDNFEVKSLESSSSEEILVSKGMVNVNTQQMDELIGISDGKPLLLKGLAAILRQERKSPDDLIAKVRESKVEEDAKEKPFNFEEEGLDEVQFSTIREMFNSLPTDSLKVSVVSISLFCGPFSVSTAAEILGISPENQAEALARLEGLVTSSIISVVNEEAKERLYDIHPLLRKYADSIKDDEKFRMAYLEAKGRFHQYFMAKMEKIAKLIDPEYVRAFQWFESDRANYEFTLEISLQPEYFSVPGEFRENALIASLFNVMLTEDKQIKLFHSWAEVCEDDGRSGGVNLSAVTCSSARGISCKSFFANNV